MRKHNMSFESVGTITEIMETQHITATFSKREFVVEIPDKNPEYKDLVKFEFIKDNCSKLDNHKVGDEVNVGWNLKGKKYTNPDTGKVSFFNTCQAWRIKAEQEQAQNNYGQAPAPYQQAAPAPTPNFNSGIVEDDPSVPF